MNNNTLIKIIMALSSIIIGFIISKIFFTIYIITDSSMEPGFLTGDRVVISKIINPDIGDPVLLKSPVEKSKVLFKRIIATEGDTIELINKIIYINNKKTKFKWKSKSIDERIFPMKFTYRDNMPVIKLKRNEFFLIGDNLDYSFDSRIFGIVSRNTIIGKAIYNF